METDDYQLALQLAQLLEDEENEELQASTERSNTPQAPKSQETSEAETHQQNETPCAQTVEEMEAQLLEMQRNMQLLQEEVNQKKGITTVTSPTGSTGLTNPRILTETDLFSSKNSVSNTKTPCSKASQNTAEKSVVHEDKHDSSDEDFEYLTAEGCMIKKRLAHSPKYDTKNSEKKDLTWKNTPNRQPKIKEMMPSGGETEFYSGLKIINPLISFSTIQSRMEGRKMIRMSLIHAMMRGGDIEGDWVTIGVVVSKVPPKVSKSGKTFSIWKMSDLRDCSKLISLFLFGEIHHEHWKTSVGTVIGLLNPTIMSKKEDSRYNDLSLTVDHPGKLMHIGTSKEMGFCKSRTKNGDTCGALVNLSLCDVCDYHIQARYRKLSSRRPDLQGTFSGVQPSNIKSKILNKQQIMYGGQVFVSPPVRTPGMLQGKKQKNQLTFESLKLQHRAKELQKALSQSRYEETPLKTLAPCPSLDNAPTSLKFSTPKPISKVGSTKIGSSGFVSVTPKELLKMQTENMKNHSAARNALRDLSEASPKAEPAVLKKDVLSLTPQLGKGLSPGSDVCLDVPLTKRKVDAAKMRAIEKIKRLKGSIEPVDPNAVKKKISPKVQEKIRKRIEASKGVTAQSDNDPENDEHSSQKESSLAKLDLNAPEIQKIINKKSKYSFEAEQDDLEKQEKYFHQLEKKEQMEMKMESIMKLECDVVSCKQCHYTAYQPSELCKNENHLLVRHKATKRFFRCTVCGHRTVAFTRIPIKGCRQCGESKFERTSMMKPRTGPKLDNEALLLRGEEIKFLNSLKK